MSSPHPGAWGDVARLDLCGALVEPAGELAQLIHPGRHRRPEHLQVGEAAVRRRADPRVAAGPAGQVVHLGRVELAGEGTQHGCAAVQLGGLGWDGDAHLAGTVDSEASATATSVETAHDDVVR